MVESWRPLNKRRTDKDFILKNHSCRKPSTKQMEDFCAWAFIIHHFEIRHQCHWQRKVLKIFCVWAHFEEAFENKSRKWKKAWVTTSWLHDKSLMSNSSDFITFYCFFPLLLKNRCSKQLHDFTLCSFLLDSTKFQSS